MPNPNQQREALKRAYSGAEWAKKVKAMSDAQVAAVYLRLQSQNKLK